MAGIFKWLSPLGASVTMFSLCGLLLSVIGAVWPFLEDKPVLKNRFIFMSHRTDKIFFGVEPETLLNENAALVKLRAVMSGFMGGTLLVVGILILCVAWFGLRQKQPWALATLSGTGFLMIPFWYLSLRPYLQAGISLTLADLPPIFWIPATLLLPATILGWIGLR